MSGSDANLTAQVLASLNRLANKLALLDETTSVQSCKVIDDDDDLIKRTDAMCISEKDDDGAQKMKEHDDGNDDDNNITQLQAAQQLSILPSQSLSHWRTLPPDVTSAYQLLVDGASYIHATSTKYTLISNTGHNQESGDLAVELRRGAELLGTGTLLLFSESCGSSRSLKHYVKLHARAVIASVISLLQYFEDVNAGGNELKNYCNNNIGAQKTGAIWSACDKITSSLPRGNRAAMRRELMVWMRDCNESIAEFEELVSLGPKLKEQEGGEDDEDEEQQYTAKELKLAKASVNLMKCSKNVLNLVMSALECVGDHLETSSSSLDKNASNDMLQYISKLHDRARLIGVGVTNFGVLLYPPFDMEMDEEEGIEWLSKKSNFSCSVSIPNLVITPLGLELDCQLHAMLECVESVHSAGATDGFTAIDSCMSKEVVDSSERLLNAVHIRSKEIEEAVYW